ncbi:ATP-binding protein [Nannocystis pusilla]|uniref:ATP-binding protein n=1 Tax=Nannocystis pusilla TaxID=889268 RepID=UPI003B7BB22B
MQVHISARRSPRRIVSTSSIRSRKAAPRHASASWGLGLALVRACAKAHGGSVSVESDEADGTTFTMVLPLDARLHQAA